MRAIRRIVPLLAISLALPASASAQELPAGTWTGTITPPNGSAIDATFDVSVQGDSIGIVLKGPFGSATASLVVLHPDRLTFVWSPGPQVVCTLMLGDGGSYAGDCVDAQGGIGVIVMNPPEGSPAARPGDPAVR